MHPSCKCVGSGLFEDAIGMAHASPHDSCAVSLGSTSAATSRSYIRTEPSPVKSFRLLVGIMFLHACCVSVDASPAAHIPDSPAAIIVLSSLLLRDVC
jgi:hypothetical protein